MSTATSTIPDDAMAKAMQLARRASSEGGMLRLAAPDGAAITPEKRDELLQKCRAGEYVELDVEILAYEQRPGATNRNYVRFRDGAMLKFGASGVGKPFLRDHEQQDVMARAGTITKSRTEKRGEGDYAIQMTARLTAPWAVELALRDLISGTSIGWHSTSVLCSVCNAAVGTKCYHWPGDRLAKVTGDDGVERFVRDRNGGLVVEWVHVDPELTECSLTSIPAVPNAGVEAVRAALAATVPSGVRDTPVPVEAAEPASSPQSSQARQEEPQMSTKTAPESTEPQGPTQAEIDARVMAAAKKLRQDERDLEAVIKSHGLKLSAQDLLEKHGGLDKAKLALLDELTKNQPEIDPTHTAKVEVGQEASDKKAELIKSALYCRVSGEKPKNADEARYSRMSLLAIGDELFEDAGISSRELRGIQPQDRAKLMLGMRLPVGVNRKLAGPGMNSSSDFPTIIGSVFNTRMRALYQQRLQVWKAFAFKENLPSFESVPVYAGGRFPALLPVKQGGTYQRGSFQMSDMSVQLGKAGRIVSLTWELILADRIGLIDRIISDRVNSALRWEDSLFYTKLIANLLADGTTAIYGADNTATTGAIGTTTLSSAFVKMATRASEDGDPITVPDEAATTVYAANVKPKHWLVPVLSQVAAEALIGDGYMPTASTSAPTRDMKSLNIIGDGNLDANSITTSYLFADPNDAPVVQFGHLASEDGPVLEEEDGFTVDGKDYKVRHTAYVEFVDNIGTVRLPIT